MTSMLCGLRVIMASIALAACSAETRALGADQPQTPPHDSVDPRIARYDGNAYQIAQGGRYFTWYGSGRCHGADATDSRNLHRPIGDFARVYGAIVRKHSEANFAAHVPVEQLWEIAAYVGEVGRIDPTKRRR